MRRRAWVMWALSGLVTTACAGVGGTGMSAPAAPAWSPVGTWSFTTFAQGTTVAGSVTITEAMGAFGGTIEPDASLGMGSFPIEFAELVGQEMRVQASAMGDVLDMVLVFDGDTYEGSWSMAGDGGALSGRRLR